MCYWHSWNFCRTDRSFVSVSLPTWNAYKKSLLFYSVPNPFLPLLGFRMQWSFCFTLLTMDSGPFLWCSSFLSSPIYKAVFYVNYFILIAWKMMLILRLARRSQQVNSKCSSVFGWTLRLNYIYYDIIRTYVCPLKFNKKFHKKCVWKMGCIASHIYHTQYFCSDENSLKPRIHFVSRSNTLLHQHLYFRHFLISLFAFIC